MKRFFLLSVVLAASIALVAGCQKSELEKMNELREEQNIAAMSDSEALSNIVGGKKLVLDIFQSIDEEGAVEDEYGMTYFPFTDKYDSPEKIAEGIGKYYYGDYAEELEARIPAEYIDDRYMIPVGDIGMLPDYDSFIMVDRSDRSEKDITIRYKMSEESKEIYTAYFEYVEGSWKITDEIREFED